MKRTAFLLTIQQSSWRDKFRQLMLRVVPDAPAEHLLSGRVCNEAGDPVAFARVEAGGTPYHTEANAAGYFVLHIPEAQLRHPISLFVFAPGYVRFEHRIERISNEQLECILGQEQLAKVVDFQKFAKKAGGKP